MVFLGILLVLVGTHVGVEVADHLTDGAILPKSDAPIAIAGETSFFGQYALEISPAADHGFYSDAGSRLND
ncbi:MAG: hypothetical protein AAB425_10750 [Bdellovibrionota bacterium]